MEIRRILEWSLVVGVVWMSVISVEAATSTVHRGVHVLHLEGSSTSRAYQHGQLARGLIAKGESAINYYSTRLQAILDSGDLSWLERRFISYVIRRIRADLSVEQIDLISAFANGAGMKVDDALTAAILPDLATYLWSHQVRAEDRPSRDVSSGFRRLLRLYGCSSLVIEPSRSNNGLIHARNFDYPPEGIWEKNATLVYHHPQVMGQIGYGAVTTLGVPLAPTVFNSAGLIFDVHMLTVKDVSLSGTPILFVLDQLAREAQTLADADRIIRATSVLVPWRINVSSASEGRTLSYDVYPDGLKVGAALQGTLATTNHILDPQRKDREFFGSYREWRDTNSRLAYLEAAALSRDRHSVQSVIDAIGSFRLSETSSSPLAALDSLQSVVFVPKENVLYLAVPEREFEQVHAGRFVAFPMWPSSRSISHWKNEPGIAFPDRRVTDLPRRDRLRANGLFRRAVYTAEVGDASRAMAFLQEALRLDPKNVDFTLMIALSHLQTYGRKDHRDSDLDRTLELLDRADHLSSPGYQRQLIALFRGRVFALRGDRAAAKIEALRAAASSWTPLRNAAEKDLRRQYRRQDLARLQIDLIIRDVIQF